MGRGVTREGHNHPHVSLAPRGAPYALRFCCFASTFVPTFDHAQHQPPSRHCGGQNRCRRYVSHVSSLIYNVGAEVVGMARGAVGGRSRRIAMRSKWEGSAVGCTGRDMGPVTRYIRHYYHIHSSWYHWWERVVPWRTGRRRRRPSPSIPPHTPPPTLPHPNRPNLP